MCEFPMMIVIDEDVYEDSGLSHEYIVYWIPGDGFYYESTVRYGGMLAEGTKESLNFIQALGVE